MGKEEIRYYEAKDAGDGLPFAIVPSELLLSNNDIFVPSLRDFHVIFWFKKGTGRYFIDFDEYQFEENSIVLISKDHLHYFDHFSEDVEIQSITFTSDFIYRNDADLKHLFNFNVGRHEEGVQVLKLNETDAKYLGMTSAQMLHIFNTWEGEERSETFYHLLCNFLIKCEMMQSLNREERSIDDDSKTMLDFHNLIELNFREHTKVDFYLSELNLTVKGLSRIVKEKLKTSPKSVIDARRTLELKRQLKGTTKPVKEIAYELGFDEPTNMVKFFKKHVGMTPGAFRDH